MSKLPTYPVNKVPFDGPTTFKGITEQIAQDAKEKGMDITPKNIAFVIQFVFSKRGALNSIPHFVYASVRGFGKWLPDPEGMKLRIAYYAERVAYMRKFRSMSNLNKSMVKRAKRRYQEYLETNTAEIKLGYAAWKRATGYKHKLDVKYRRLNRLKHNYVKREKEVYGYVLTRKKK